MKNIIYGDTDSVYVTLKRLVDVMPRSKGEVPQKQIIKIADEIGEIINSSFPEFMSEAFLVSPKRGEVIQAGREVVGRKGLFKDVKKRYAIHVIDNEGRKVDKLKIMGMEVRRSDTPKIIQRFLEDCIGDVVQRDIPFQELYDKVQDFRHGVFRKLNPWERGTPGRVSNLSHNTLAIERYEESLARGYMPKKPFVHYSVAASVNTNKLIDLHGETRWDKIRDGDKIEILYLLPNQLHMDSVAIKVEETYIPPWFSELPFDNRKHEQKMIDKKLDNVIGSILNWDFSVKTDLQDEVFEEVDFFD